MKCWHVMCLIPNGTEQARHQITKLHIVVLINLSLYMEICTNWQFKRGAGKTKTVVGESALENIFKKFYSWCYLHLLLFMFAYVCLSRECCVMENLWECCLCVDWAFDVVTVNERMRQNDVIFSVRMYVWVCVHSSLSNTTNDDDTWSVKIIKHENTMIN